MNYLSFVVSGFFWKCFTSIKADIVFNYETSPMTQTLVGVWFARKRKVPFYLYVTDLWPDNVEIITGIHNKLLISSLNSMVNYIYRKCTKIFTSSKSFITDLGNQTIEQLRNNSEKLKNYADSEIQTTTNIITKAMGKEKVLVSQSDITATQQTAADTSALMDNVNAANKSIKKIREKTDRNFAKSEKVPLELNTREKVLDEREESIVRREWNNIMISQQNDIDRENITERLKICQECEFQLDIRTNNPHKFYNDKITKLDEENLSLKKNITDLKSDNTAIQQNVVMLNKQLDEKERTFTKRLAAKEQEIAAEYENRLREKDGIIKSLKIVVDRAYHIICNICGAATVLWCGKGKFADYAMDFSSKQSDLMRAILDYGAKSARKADSHDLADKIGNEYFICSDIR